MTGWDHGLLARQAASGSGLRNALRAIAYAILDLADAVRSS